MFVCGIDDCQKQFSRRYHLKRHQTQVHLNDVRQMERCILCYQLFETCEELQNHYARQHKPSRYFLLKDSAFRRNFVTYRYNFLPNEKDFPLAQKNLKRLLQKQILRETVEKVIARVSLIFLAEMVMLDNTGQQVTQAVIPFRSNSFHVNGQNPRGIEKQIRLGFQEQQRHLDDFMRSGSNWQFSRAIAFDLEISAVKPLRGGCSFVDESVIGSHKNLFNPPSTKSKCFLFCIAYFLLFGLMGTKKFTLDDHYRMKQKVKTFNTKNIRFPIAIIDIKRFLKQNNLNLKINILIRTTDDIIYPYEYGLGKGERLLNLLLVQTNKGAHYMLLTNPDNFLKRRFRSQNGHLEFGRMHYCMNCLNGFRSFAIKQKHVETCILNKPRLEFAPTEDEKIICFTNQERKHFLEYIAYLDFECILPDSKSKCNNCNSLKCKCDSWSIKDINTQLPICFSFIIIKGNNEVIHEYTYAGKDAHLHLIEHLLEQEESWLSALLNSNKQMQMTDEDSRNYKRSSECYLCKMPFSGQTIKVRDHSHYTGDFLGAACQKCNLRRRMPKRLKIFVHNCAKYDMHFIIKGISNFRQSIKNISVLPYNGEHFRTLRFNSFEFVDTLAFLQASLSQLASDLKLTSHSYPIIKQSSLVKKNGRVDFYKFNLILGKSFFPYEFCSSYSKMKETKQLPQQRHFYSSLSEKSISEEDHAFAQNVWETFNCRNLVDYTKLYCEIDTFLLAEIFQTFRDRMYAFSGLDPAHYISLPAYGYDSMLLITNAKIELPTDINMIHFMEKCKRGGVSFINTRHLKEDNQGSILYLDQVLLT